MLNIILHLTLLIIKNVVTYFKNKPSVLIIILIGLTITEVHLNLTRYNNNNVLKWDAIGYYSYLPAFFIEKDVTLNFITPKNETSYHWVKYGYIKTTHGEKIIKYSMGVALLIAPFFLIAHSLAMLGCGVPDGFSSIYLFAVEFSGLFYLLIGFVYLRKLLLNFYTEKIIAIAFLLMYFASNLLYHSAIDAVNPHVFSFALFSVFLYLTHRFYQKYSYKNALLLGLVFGLIILVRPINLFFIIPFAFYNVFSIASFKKQLAICKTNWLYYLIFIATSVLIVSIQLLYYKQVTGSYILFSYGNTETFYFKQPHLVDVLFSFRKGWFIYTPMMLVILSWFILKNKIQTRLFNFGTIVLVGVYLYFISSWWCWWYGGSFGQRALIDLYPILIFPLCSLIYQILQWQTQLYQKIMFCVLGLLLILNCFQSLQAKYNIIDWDGMTYKAYIHTFGSYHSEDIRKELLQKPDYEKAVRGIEE